MISLCRDALSRHPDYRTLYLNLGWALREQGKLDDAIAVYRDAFDEGRTSRSGTTCSLRSISTPATTAGRLYTEHLAWANQFAKPHAVRPPSTTSTDRRPGNSASVTSLTILEIIRWAAFCSRFWRITTIAQV